MNPAYDRVFKRYKARFVPIVCAGGVAGTWLAMAAAAAIGIAFGALAGILTGVALFWLMFDRIILAGNGWLRRELANKLRSLGEPVETGRDRFVGLAHPSQLTSPQRLAETDDDVGFLAVGPGGLSYHGDSLEFDVPAEQIGEVRVVRSFYAPWGRVAVEILDHEPFDEVIFDSRSHGSFGACQRDNRRLARELQRAREMAKLGRPQTRRLAAEERIDAAELLGR